MANGDNQSKAEFWGSSDRYCAQGETNIRRPISPAERDIGRRLEERFPHLRERVERAFRESNTQLREALRTETGLRLSNDKMRQNVPVRVVDGIPAPLLAKFPEDSYSGQNGFTQRMQDGSYSGPNGYTQRMGDGSYSGKGGYTQRMQDGSYVGPNGKYCQRMSDGSLLCN